MAEDPLLYRVDQCRSCHQPIIWAVTTAGKVIPVDAEPPLAGGTIALEHRAAVSPLARVLTTVQQFGRTGLRTAHFSRCPQAGQWRKRARARRSDHG